MSGEHYIIATVSGVYMFPLSKVYKTKNGALNEYKQLYERSGDKNLRILKAQWIGADFDEYIHIKELIENETEGL